MSSVTQKKKFQSNSSEKDLPVMGYDGETENGEESYKRISKNGEDSNINSVTFPEQIVTGDSNCKEGSFTSGGENEIHSPSPRPLMKIVLPIKTDASKLFKKVTFCLKLIYDRDNYEDLKSTIIERGGSVTDVLTSNTDMLLVEYDINAPEMMDRFSNDPNSGNMGDRLVIIEAISRNITVAVDIYVWQCILNSDLVPIDDFEFVRTIEDRFSFSIRKKMDLVDSVPQTNRDSYSITEHSQLRSPSPKPQPKKFSHERCPPRQTRASFATSYTNKKFFNKYYGYPNRINPYNKFRGYLRGGELSNYDFNGEMNSSEDDLYSANLVPNIHYYDPSYTKFDKNNACTPDSIQNSQDPVRDFVINCSTRSNVSYLKLLCPHLKSSKNNWGSIPTNYNIDADNDNSYSPDLNVQVCRNPFQTLTPSNNNPHNRATQSKDSDFIFKHNSHTNTAKHSPRRSCSNIIKDSYCDDSSSATFNLFEYSLNCSTDQEEASTTDKQSEVKDDPLEYAPDILLDAGTNMDLRFNTTHAERLKWSSTLRSILASDFIRTAGYRPLSGFPVDKNSKPDAGDQIWLEIRANLHGISVDEEQKMVETQRKRVGLVLEEVLRASFADTAELTVYDQVIDLLERVLHYKSLYPSSKVLKNKNPHFSNPTLQRRLDALSAWLNIKNSMFNHIYLINTWVQSYQWPARCIKEIFTTNKGTELSAIEIFLKKMPTIREFQCRIINTLKKALLMIKNVIADNAKTFHRMKLSVDIKDLERLSQFCSNMIVETLKIQIQLSDVFTKHGDNILEHVIESFSEDLSLSLKAKEMSKEIDQSSDGWLIESCLSLHFDSTILRFVKCYFSLMKLRLIEASEQVFFKEAEMVKSKWTFMMKVRDTIECTNVEITIQFCRLASELINRLFLYIKYHTYQPLDLNNLSLVSGTGVPQQDVAQMGNTAQIERISKHCARIIDNTKTRARKLLVLFKMLRNEFENCSEYQITSSSVRSFLDRLAETRHVLVRSDLCYSRKVIICASASLMNSPHKIISLLKNCPKRTVARNDDPYCYVLIIVLKKHPGYGFKWKGNSVQINVQKILKSIDMEDNTVRLVVENTNLLSNSRQKFESAVTGLVKNIKTQKAHIELVRNELKKIRETTLNLSLAICSLAEKISFLLSSNNLNEIQQKQHNQEINQIQQSLAGQNYDIVQDTYMFASGFAFKNTKWFYKSKKSKYLQSQLLNLSLGWIEFCTNTDESELPPEVMKNVYNWHITALKFLTNLTNGNRILLSSKRDFTRLKNTVSECLLKVSKMFSCVIEVDECEKINLDIDYRFNTQNDTPSNVMSEDIGKKLSEIGFNNYLIDSIQIRDLHDEIYPKISPECSVNSATKNVEINSSDRIEVPRNMKSTLANSNNSNDQIVIYNGSSLCDNTNSKPNDYIKQKHNLQRIGAFDKIVDVSSANDQILGDMDAHTSHKSRVDYNCIIEARKSVENRVNSKESLSQYSDFISPSSSRAPYAQQSAKQELTKYVPQNYFNQFHKYKALGRRLFLGIENLYMLQKKNRWRRKINELEEKIASKQRSLSIIGKMLDNTSCEDRNISLIAKNSGSISMRWRQGSYIGSGSFGDVYIGTNLETGDVMAVKEIKFIDARNLEKLAKFIIEEMNVLQMLHHPNIIDYYGIEVFRDRIYIFMECCKYSLAKVLGVARFRDENILKIYSKHLLRGLSYLHGNNIIHRDIKPANILFSREGRIKYVDFGASKIFRTEDNIIGYNCDTRTLVGTPQYIAPEVVNNELNHNSGSRDVWALGCCILQMFTGRPPWGNTDNDWAIMWQIGTSKEHPEIPAYPIISEDAIDFLEKCFTPSARERPTAEELMRHKWTADIEGECPEISYIEKLLASASAPKQHNYNS